MQTVPAELIMPVSFEASASPYLLKPVFGTIDKQFVRFYMAHVYNDSKSKALGYEVMEPCEMCEIVNDRYSKFVCKVTELNRLQKAAFAKLYEAFKEQKDFEGTLVEKWSAINESEKALLMHSKIMTVEQLAQAEDSTRAHLGPYAAELIAKAKRHVEAKAEKMKSEQYADEISTLRAEIERVRAEAREREEEMYKKYAAIAKGEEKPRARKSRKTESVETTNEIQQSA